MDLSRLTRPAILCQCFRCSSSLAALENEWARLSNSYSMATAWLSVDLQRISISSERKQIPQTSDLSFLRGRIIQEVTCKLCQQKLGVLCELDNGPHIFWKMTKVSFREIVTMRTVEPLVKEGALDRLNTPTPKESRPRDCNSAEDGALVPTGRADMATFDPSMQHQMQHQGRSIDQISNSVNNLQDTMTDLKHSFTALRIELNDPSRHFAENGTARGDNLDMIAPVLKELKCKSDEMEKLKLEIEALKLKNRFIEEHTPLGALREVQSPGLLQAGRKRPWHDGRTQSIADSFDEEDDVNDDPLVDLSTNPARVPIKGPHTVREDTGQQSTAKRRRLSQTDPPYQLGSTGFAQKRPVGRPRKSISQPTRPDLAQITPAASSNEHRETPVFDPSPSVLPSRGRGRPRKHKNGSQSHRSSPSAGVNGHTNSEDVDQAGDESMQTAADDKPDEPKTDEIRPASAHASHVNGENGTDDGERINEKRKAKVAARDLMTRIAMQHEEAIETGEGQ